MEHAIAPVSPFFSPYFLLDLLFLCSGMPLPSHSISRDETTTSQNETPSTPHDETPSWATSLLLSLLRRMNEPAVGRLDESLYHTQTPSLLYPFQLFGFFASAGEPLPVRSASATRCQLLLTLLLSVNCTTQNPFSEAFSRIT